MIISRTPFRVSFFGGGTDYPEWYEKEGGAVLSTTIDKFLYISARHLPPFFDMRHRIVWSKVETVHKIADIQHPVIREGLKDLGYNDDIGLDIHYQADLPARSGMGSSSSFAVGFINALTCLRGRATEKRELASRAINLEQNILKETVGVQDQTAAAYGGLNRMEFQRNGQIHVAPVIISPQRMAELESHMMLFYTGLARYSFEIASTIIENLPKRKSKMKRINEMVDEGVEILTGGGSIVPFGRLLNEGWQLKRSLSDGISTGKIDDIYESALENGALGGKLLGAGGGGFFMFLVPPEDQPRLKEHLKDLLYVPVKLSSQGSTIIHYEAEPVFLNGVD